MRYWNHCPLWHALVFQSAVCIGGFSTVIACSGAQERVVEVAKASAFNSAASALAYMDGLEAALVTTEQARILAEIKAKNGTLVDYDKEVAKWGEDSGHRLRQERIERVAASLKIIARYLAGESVPAKQEALDVAESLDILLSDLASRGLPIPDQVREASAIVRKIAEAIP